MNFKKFTHILLVVIMCITSMSSAWAAELDNTEENERLQSSSVSRNEEDRDRENGDDRGTVPPVNGIKVRQVTITGIRLTKKGLVLALKWRDSAKIPDRATVVLLDGQGQTNSETVIRPNEGEEEPTIQEDGVNNLAQTGGTQTVVIPENGINNPAETGWTQTIVVQDEEGQLLGSQNYDISLDCETGGEQLQCTYDVSLTYGTDGSAIVISPELDAALDEAEEQGQENVFETIMEKQPELTGEIIVYMDLISKKIQNISDCQCTWSIVQYDQPHLPHSLYANDDTDLYKFGYRGPGAAHWLGTYYNSGGGEVSTNSQDTRTEINMQLRCFQSIQEIEITPVILPNGSIKFIKTIIQSTTEPCQAPCDVQYEHRGEYNAGLMLKIRRSGWPKRHASAIIQQEGLYTVNGVPELNRASGLAKEEDGTQFDFNLSIPGLGGVEVTNNSVGVTSGSPTDEFSFYVEWEDDGNDNLLDDYINSATNVSTSGLETTAVMETDGYAYSDGGGHSDALALAANSYMMAVYGYASCALPEPQAATWAYHSYDGVGASVMWHGNSTWYPISAGETTCGLKQHTLDFFTYWGVDVRDEIFC